MDGSHWKRVLLHWINHSSLLQRTFYSIDQTDVEVFFEKFRSRISKPPIEPVDLILFIKEQYSEFELHLDDDKNLSSCDYMYVYSLLLHYSCVKYPEPYFHGICEALPEQYQQAIASFFKIILENPLTKENLRRAISGATPKSPVTFAPLDSPLRTPRNKVSPPTPKTNMLEERTKELIFIKAQLEAERYEKGLMEVQLKQNEDRTQKLAQEQKHHLAEIHNLKNELLTKNTENCSPNKNLQDEQIKRRLRKDLAQKEETILSLRDNLEVLKEDKALICEKLAYAEKEFVTCLGKIKEMDFVINDLKSEVEHKDSAIQTLTETKNELELFIKETRSSSQGFKNDFNMSAECLDVSLSRITNSSGSLVSSPENLGVSVVDIKLREKENENFTLHEQIERMKTEGQKLKKHVCDLTVRYSDVFDIYKENLILVDDVDLTHVFVVFENYLEKVAERYTTSNRNLKSLRDENMEMQSLNIVMNKKIIDIEQNLDSLKMNSEMLRLEKLDLQQRLESCALQSKEDQDDINSMKKNNTEMSSALNYLRGDYEQLKLKYQDDIIRMDAENLSITSDLNALRKEHEKIVKSKTESISKLTAENVELSCTLKVVRNDYENANQEVNKIKNENKKFEQQIFELLDDLKDKSNKIDILEELNDKFLSTVGSHAEEIQQFKNQISDLKKTIENLEKLICDEKVHLTHVINVTQNEIICTRKELSESKMSYENLFKRYEQQGTLISKLELDLDTSSLEKMNAITKMKEDQSQKVEEYKHNIEENKNKYIGLQNEKKKLINIIDEKNLTLGNLSSKLDEVNREKELIEENLVKEKENLQQKINSLQDKLEEEELEIRNILKTMLLGQGDELNIDELDNPIKILKGKITILVTANNKLIASGTELRITISELRDQINELHTANEEYKKLVEQNLDSAKNLKLLEEEKRKQAMEIKTLIVNFKESEHRQNELENDKRLTSCQISALTKKVESISTENRKLLTEISSLEVNEKTIIGKYEKLREEIGCHTASEMKLISALTAKNVEFNVEHERSTAQLQAYKLDQNTLHQQLQDHVQTVLEQNNKIAMLQNFNIKLTDQIDHKTEAENLAVNKLKSALDEVDNQEKMLGKFEKENICLLKELEDKTYSLNKAVEEINEMQLFTVASNASQKQMEETISRSQLKINELEDKILILETSLKGNEIVSLECHQAVESMENEHQLLGVKISKLELSNKTLQENLIEIEGSLRQSQSVNVELLSQLDELKISASENAERDTDYINLQLKYVAVCAEKERFSDSKLKLEESCSKLTKRVKKLSIKFEELQDIARKLEKSNVDSRVEIESLQKTFNQNKAVNEELEIKLKQIKRDLKLAVEKGNNTQQLYNEAVRRHEIMQKETQELQLQIENKSLEINEQNALLKEMKFDLQNKVELITRVNSEFSDLKSKREQLMAENNLLREKVGKFIAFDKTLEKTKEDLQDSLEALDKSRESLKESRQVAENLERENIILKTRMKEVINAEENLKESTTHINNINHVLEIKVEKLSSTLENMKTNLELAQSENIEVKNQNSTLRFNLESISRICGLVRDKSEVSSSLVSTESICTNYYEIVESVNQLSINNQNLQDINTKLSIDLENSHEKSSKLCDNLSKLELKLQIMEDQNRELASEVKELQTLYDILRIEKENVEKENVNTVAILNNLETRQNEILHDHVISHHSLERQVLDYAAQIKEKLLVVKNLELELTDVIDQDKIKAIELTNKNEQLNELEGKLESMQQEIYKEKEITQKQREDISIFQAKLYKNRQLTEEKEKKWQEEKKILMSENEVAEGRIKDNRLELEGKLEKMKNKMKSLYNDEVTKLRTKHDRDIVDYKSEVKDLLAENEKYETYVQKLAKQIFNLNETILELQKQNKFMETKLKDLESIPSTFRRHSQFPSHIINSNLRMEDEEGEIFNNTYLADLENGRSSPFRRDSVSVNELHYRNSLAPPHLRSTYIAQYPDQHIREEDIKDMPINLDDSLSSLLHAGQRKKMSGTTSYKKPGPPTPSKNGGRLSFGGGPNDLHPREILKECNDPNLCNTKKTTPAKFRSMFSSSKLKDENITPPKRRLSNLFKGKK